MANQKTDYVEDEETLFNSFSSPVLYYVQSPSTVSHANSNNNELAIVLSSPYQSENYVPPRRTNPNHDVARFILSRYSSHGSNNTFIHEKKISYDLQSHETNVGTESGETGTLLRICGVEEHDKDNDIHCNDNDYEEDDYGMGGKRRGLGRYFSFGTSPSCCWISLQISWRLLVSLCAALLVFYLATNPPPPVMSVK
ncbi:Dual specificity protein kinase, partial [Thalictrum thalictroides]